MNYAALYYDDTVNGTGYRTSLFVSGCSKFPRCKGCYNKKAWDFNYGLKYTQETKDAIIESLKKPYTRGISILGGEPFNNIHDGDLIDLVKTIKEMFPDKTVFVWSGYKFEELMNNNKSLEFMKYIDMVRDGEFIEELKDVTQYLQGSKNQRCVDVQKSLKAGKVIEYKFV